MIPTWIAVALGGALGALGRYGLSLWLNQSRWDLSWGTLVANLLGSLVIGGLLAYDHVRSMPEFWRLFLIVGCCGALTTFSSFAAETLLLALRDKIALALLTIGLHLIGCLVMVGVGYGALNKLL